MMHCMKLSEIPFNAVATGYKTIELRLDDKKRQALNVGDFIEFTCVSDSGMTVSKEIKALHRFLAFEKLYKNLPLLSCGYTPFTLPYARETLIKCTRKAKIWYNRNKEKSRTGKK